MIDYEASDRSTSEGQAYALLRAVLINDPATFALTLNWSENNLQGQAAGKRTDSLWAWKWGRKEDGNWGVIDSNFASDGDIDAITALILVVEYEATSQYAMLYAAMQVVKPAIAQELLNRLGRVSRLHCI